MRRAERAASVPITSEAGFNDTLFTEAGRTKIPWARRIRSSMRENHPIVMTHGDLHPGNIMVTWDGCTSTGACSEAPDSQTSLRITSILDWELSGWYPEGSQYNWLERPDVRLGRLLAARRYRNMYSRIRNRHAEKSMVRLKKRKFA